MPRDSAGPAAAPAVAPAVAPRRAAVPLEIWALVAGALLIAIGFGIVAPVIPQYARSFGVGIFAATTVVSAFAAARLLFAPVSGALTSRLGEAPVYLTGLLTTAVSTGACAFAGEYWMFLVLRSIAGIGSTMFTVSAMALIVRLSPVASRGRVAGLYGTAFLTGNVVGPLIGGELAGLGLRAPFLIYAGFLVVATAIVFLILRGASPREVIAGEPAPVMSLREAAAKPAYLAALVGNFGVGWATFGVRIAMVPLLVTESLHRDPGSGGLALTAFALGTVALLLPGGRIADRIGRRLPLVAGLTLATAGTVGIALCGDFGWFLAWCVISGAGSGLMTAPLNASVADIVGRSGGSGPVLAVFQMVSDIGAIVGPLITGWIADAGSFRSAFLVTAGVQAVGIVAWLIAPETHVKVPRHGVAARGGSGVKM